jgi:hypothetical protein
MSLSSSPLTPLSRGSSQWNVTVVMAVVLVVLVEILNVESVLFILVFDPFKQKASTEFANYVPFLIMFFF